MCFVACFLLLLCRLLLVAPFQAGLVAISLRAHTRSLSLKISDGRSPIREAREQKQSRDLVASVIRASKSSFSYRPPVTVFRSRSTPRRVTRAGGRELPMEKESSMGARRILFIQYMTCLSSHTPQPAAKVFLIDAVGTASGLKCVTVATTALGHVLILTWTQMPPLASWNDSEAGRSTSFSRPLTSKSVQEGSRHSDGGSAPAHGSIDRLQRMVSTQKSRLDEVTCGVECIMCDVSQIFFASCRFTGDWQS
jgi:hypothetical protein